METKKSSITAAREAVVLSLSMGLYSLIALSSLMFFWLPRKNHPLQEFWIVNTSEGEPMYYQWPNLSPWEKQWYDVTFAVPFFTFVPFSIFMLVKVQFSSAVFVCICTLVGYLVFTYFWHILGNGSTILPLVVFGLCVKLSMPKSTSMLTTRLLQATIFGFAIIVGLQGVPIDQTEGKLFVTCFLLPFLSEIIHIPVRSMLKMVLLTNEEYGYSKNQVGYVRREAAWVCFLWFHCARGLLARLMFSQITDATLLLAVVLYQSLMEIGLRMTLKKRDEWTIRFLTWFAQLVRCREHRYNHASSIQPAPNEQRSGKKRLTSLKQVPHLKEEFLTYLLLGESLGEFVGIVMTPVLIWLFSDAVLMMPFRYYLESDDPFSMQMDLRKLFGFSALQAGVELVVDFICAFREIRSGIPLLELFKKRSRYTWLLFVYVNWFVASLVSTITINQDRFDICNVQGRVSICDCDLVKGGVRQEYCGRYFANATLD